MINLKELDDKDLVSLAKWARRRCQKKMDAYDSTTTHHPCLFDSSWDWRTFAAYWPALYAFRQALIDEYKRRNP